MASVATDDIDVLAKARRSLDSEYTPSDDEEYMSEKQQDYFRLLLLEWKKSILSASEGTLQSLQDGPIREPDLMTGPPAKPTGASNCAPVTVSAS